MDDSLLGDWVRSCVKLCHPDGAALPLRVDRSFWTRFRLNLLWHVACEAACMKKLPILLISGAFLVSWGCSGKDDPAGDGDGSGGSGASQGSGGNEGTGSKSGSGGKGSGGSDPGSGGGGGMGGSIGGMGGNMGGMGGTVHACDDASDAMQAFFADESNRACDNDSDCATPSIGCASPAAAFCGDIPLSKTAADSMDWEDLADDADAACGTACGVCEAELIVKCVDNLCVAD